jgi:cation diffusion facilitator CzcD-associated flavoprotein CzcO
MVDTQSGDPPKIIIIGAGLAGIGMAIRLKKAGIHSFTIFEKDAEVGGTWRDNAYPGAACDVASYLYSFSFEQKTDWSRKLGRQPEILSYIRHCAEKYALLPHIRFRTEVRSASFDAGTGSWSLILSDGSTDAADFVVSCVGQLNRPFLPDLAGMDDFAGKAFHSARWDKDCSLAGKKVAVVGTAASAIQLVPKVAREAKQLYVFQRSPNWIVSKDDHVYSSNEKKLFSTVPGLAKLHRFLLWLRYESILPAIRNEGLPHRLATKVALAHLKRQVPDETLRQALTPDFPIGARRILISDDYYPALQRPNVKLVTESISRVKSRSIIAEDGSEYPADVIIFATGFQTKTLVAPMEVRGLDGKSLQDAWDRGPEAYLGISVPGFPNFFFMYGPNTNLGQSSIIFMIECQARYIIGCIRQSRRKGLRYIDLRADVMAAYDKWLQKEIDKYAWKHVERSWYKAKSGRITNNWPGSTLLYWWRTRRADLGKYRQVSA